MTRHWLGGGTLALASLAGFASGMARRWAPPVASSPTAIASAPADRIAAAADRFLATLGDDLRAAAALPFDSPVRTDWHYIPRARPGVKLKQLNDQQKHAVHELLRSALSSRGYLKATGVIALEGILRDLTIAAGHDGSGRDPENYSVIIFGSPHAVDAAGTPWGWRIEGHHLSLNFTATTGEVVASSPAFIGSNPACVPTGPHAGWRLLAAEEDLARRLMGLLAPEQRAQAIIDGGEPEDIVLSPGRALDLGKPAGLSYRQMDAAQRDTLMELVREYAENNQGDLSSQLMDRIRARGPDEIRFAWAGGEKPGEGYYYRIHGPTFIIEYDNTQDHANHVHSAWRDLEHDFGVDLLAQHYKKDHPAR